MPVLGFDGWGILNSAGIISLVLVQVKATDEDACPPGEATKLAEECRDIPRDADKIARSLSVLAVHTRDTAIGDAILGMLEILGNGAIPRITVSPGIVRGVTHPHCDDLTPVREAYSDILPANVLGIAVGISVDLADFGHTVTSKARAA
jgi:hypothetical protein